MARLNSDAHPGENFSGASKPISRARSTPRPGHHKRIVSPSVTESTRHPPPVRGAAIRLWVLNKIDALDPEALSEARATLEEASGGPVLTMSGVSHEGTTEVLRALRAEIDEDRLRQRPETEDTPWQP